MTGGETAGDAAAPRRVVIDCDPGVDDALALALAYASPELSLACVTTVVGNSDLDTVTANALRLAALCGRADVPVHAGSPRPILRPFVHAWASVHGDDGLGNTGLAPATFGPSPTHAVDALVETVMAAPGAVTLCVVGPMTNVALAILREPAFAAAVGELVFMGGAAFSPGNATPLAEFNTFVDPEAASIVLEAGIPTTMLGLDVTRQAVFEAGWLEGIASGSRVGAEIAAMVRAYADNDPCLHDPCAIAYILRPDLFTAAEAHLSVILSGEARGKTLAAVRERHRAGRAPNARVVTGCDRPGLLALMAERIGRL